MGAQDNIEKVLRNLHLILSKSEPYVKEPSKVIVDKQEMLDLLAQLNKCVYDMMDEYELTKQSRDRAEREFHKRGDEIIWDASRKAEDIYAASVMYTSEALNHIQEIINEASDSVKQIYTNMDENLKSQELLVKRNQLELKSQLQDLRDTGKYLKLIEDRNREIQKLKDSGKAPEESEAAIYANRQTEIKINQEYFDKMGIAVPGEEVDDDLVELDINVDLDADYFQWKEEQESDAKKGETNRFASVLKKRKDGKK